MQTDRFRISNSTGDHHWPDGEPNQLFFVNVDVTNTPLQGIPEDAPIICNLTSEINGTVDTPNPTQFQGVRSLGGNIVRLTFLAGDNGQSVDAEPLEVILTWLQSSMGGPTFAKAT